MELLVIAMLCALCIVQGIKLYLREELLDKYRTLNKITLSAWERIADGDFKIIRLENGDIKVVPNE